jgi:hypothetical protein
MANGGVIMSTDKEATSPAALTARLKDLARRANARDTAALAELRAFLDEHPEVAATIGNLGRLAEDAYLRLLSGEDVLAREADKHQLSQLKADLAGEHPTPLERLLVDLVAVNHLAVQYSLAAGAAPGLTLVVAQAHAKLAEIEQRRLLQAMRTLATLRALLPQGLAPAGSVKLFATPERKQA